MVGKVFKISVTIYHTTADYNLQLIPTIILNTR